jgi:hypothetical protein
MLDLWPDTIGEDLEKSPVSILREQASLLGQKTKNIVQAEVSIGPAEEDEFAHTFQIVAPAMSNYRYQLFTVYHKIYLYPVEIFAEDDILHEIAPGAERFVVAESEEEFMEMLKAVFGARKTIRIINALLSQSDPNWRPEEDIPF